MKILLKSITAFLFASACHAQVNIDQLDGSISDEELKTLAVIEENDQNRLLVDTSSTDYLKISVQSETLYVASLCICNSKNEVTVLHTSAALGSIRYKQDGTLWSTMEKFDWQMREEGMDESTIAKRKTYLKTNGWVANSMGMGKQSETEFIIDRNVFSGALRLAIGLMTAEDPNNIVGIPADGAGDCANHKLVSGDPNSSYQFTTENWINVN